MIRLPVQGDIILFAQSEKSEHESTAKTPYLVLSHQLVVHCSKVVTVVPICQTKRTYPLYIEIHTKNNMKTSGKILLDQVTTIDYETQEWLYLERVPDELIEEVLLKVKTIFQKNDD
ncbi:type II toxin-antitoxin system PemK/MazF family toxin [Vagococcus sp. BWB3-3]|uniref:Type II toxin-antitoxin system PemK/MazF family toxin n=1 Tax=Vagococcus allomyrinae TaxID=2794353 RepID=A0A940P6A3_9ENTE|nr:type II toxin-antitoxin system PemK/MazF family toxin [Vagococcus allomyrinae]MBP1041825.1 type II toxin-antitoxin system PemK/MazF family toxin [Vagococcus allomyrinae]